MERVEMRLSMRDLINSTAVSCHSPADFLPASSPPIARLFLSALRAEGIIESSMCRLKSRLWATGRGPWASSDPKFLMFSSNLDDNSPEVKPAWSEDSKPSLIILSLVSLRAWSPDLISFSWNSETSSEAQLRPRAERWRDREYVVVCCKLNNEKKCRHEFKNLITAEKNVDPSIPSGQKRC